MPYSPAPHTSLLFLVRHAATLNNVARPPRLQGIGADEGLSDAGRDQARRTAALLADQPIGAVYSSPLPRALETARIIAVPHALEPRPVAALREIDVGSWEGRSWIDIQHEHPDAYQRFMADPASHGYLGGEDFTQVSRRVVPVVEDLMRTHEGELILVVGHNIVNRVLLATFLEVPLAKARGIDQDNGGVNVIRYREGAMQVLSVNVAFHLR
jgi:broad specificity phosphatase PhoE